MPTRRDFLSAAAGFPLVAPVPASPPLHGARIFDVTAFGARGDSNVDESAAIQQAVDAARAASGGTVYFPRGAYQLGRELTLSNLTDVTFAGAGSASLLVGPAEPNYVIFRLETPRRVAVSHLRFAGVDAAGTVAIRAADPTHLRVHACHMQGGNSGIRVFGTGAGGGARAIHITDNLIEDLTGAGAGIIIGPFSRDIIITANTVDGAGEEGISLDGSGAADDADQPHGATIGTNRVRRTGRAGIAVYRASDVSISGNAITATGPGFPAIGVSTDSAGIVCRQVAIGANVVDDAGEDGMRHFAAAGNTIRDVHHGDGLNLGGAAHAAYGSVTGNTVINLQRIAPLPGFGSTSASA